MDTLPLNAAEMDREDLARRLEQGLVVVYPDCPFPLPCGDDLDFLARQQPARRGNGAIGLELASNRLVGCRRQAPEELARTRDILAEFSGRASQWLAGILPGYASAWRPGRVDYRPLEEATRCAGQSHREDLLHVDAEGPSQGWRLLRLFVNVHPIEPRVWVTSETFPRLLERFGRAAGLPRPKPAWRSWLRRQLARLVGTGAVSENPLYDGFMPRFQNFLKGHDNFQERTIKRLWSFPPGCLWLAMTDTLSHAVLRGRCALEHSYFVAPATLVEPALAPAWILAQACGQHLDWPRSPGWLAAAPSRAA